MTIYFISGNKHKYEELKAVLPNLEMKSIDLPEIQDMKIWDDTIEVRP